MAANVSVAVHLTVPAQTLKEFIAYAKAYPGTWLTGSTSVSAGNPVIWPVSYSNRLREHLIFLQVPYRGTGWLIDLASSRASEAAFKEFGI